MWQAWYDLIMTCWETDPGDRPTFAKLNVSISSLLEEQSASLPPVRDIGSAVRRLSRGDSRNNSKTDLFASLKAPKA